MHRAVLFPAVLLSLVAASGCALSPRYHINSPIDREDYTIGFVEFDDQGWLQRREQMETVLASVNATVQQGGAIIVVYVHGWHHSADEKDSDVEEFRKAL